MSAQRTLIFLGLWFSGSCGGRNPEQPSDAASDGARDSAGPIECQAQRAVFLVGGNGGLAWFTLMWPMPWVITNFIPEYAYDNPSVVKSLGTPERPLFVRKRGEAALWEGLGVAPLPTAFVAGTNQTHSDAPSSLFTNGSTTLSGASAVLQASLAPSVPAISFGVAYANPGGAPPLAIVADVGAAMALFPTAVADQLRPSTTQLQRYLPANAPTSVVRLGTQLAFTANAFRLGLVGTVIAPAFNDDPHPGFDNSAATGRAEQLVTVLDEFYRDLATSSEVGCSHDGKPLSLADNTVMVVLGDTPKNSFVRAGWSDGTIAQTNYLYLRSNGFTKPGWFGQLVPPNVHQSFDPTTGGAVADDRAAVTNATFAAVLYAIARGDGVAIQPFSAANINGIKAQ